MRRHRPTLTATRFRVRRRDVPFQPFRQNRKVTVVDKDGGTKGVDSGDQRAARNNLVQGFAETNRLSRREREVVHFAAMGFCNKEIAASLGCSPQTVAVYWGRIYRKTRCHSQCRVLAALLICALNGYESHGMSGSLTRPVAQREAKRQGADVTVQACRRSWIIPIS